jgi:chloramphenicol O-acetyltransferase type A
MEEGQKSSFTEVDIEEWNRSSAYRFFLDYEDPFFNMTAQMDVTRLDGMCRKESLSFSISALYFSQRSANSIDEFRIRLLEGRPVIFDRVEATQTILLENESFGFCYFPWRKSLRGFNSKGREMADHYRKLATFDVESGRIDLIYYSVIPWVSFTSFKHASRFDRTQTVPRIVFGRKYEDGGKVRMPVSVEANHTMMDGLHAGRYFERLQDFFDRCGEFIGEGEGEGE